ncbi:Poly(A) polymerase [Trichoderma reesei RUT C-30]|uniref:Poly(A) polymerase n=1 Tax=Hypocrea jecorina (strain ATCC 56765 / BCRC 32924 / NRRL 11460 / Rut C-30) TaxID=1344414 RepID=A0A024RXY7_HYPJR|nr:Poly(A) polymerase [Trichoderma reesei RUT C-30]
MASEQNYGVTPPISVTLPTEAENRASDALLEELRRQKTFESPSDTEKRHLYRKAVLKSLQEICNEFVRKVAREREPKNDILIKNARGKVFTYGSFRLGVYGPGSDIDTLIVAPKYVTREDYFNYFPDLLVSMAPPGAITDLTVVKDAFVPIIKFEYSGISIDLIFSRIIQKQISPDFDSLKDSSLLRGLDEAELRSLNGTRVTDEILDLVPEKSTFRLALRAIKLWAQRRAVYANIMGFPGGVAWAMLVARVCQLYPKATMSVIVNKFFLVIGQWRWPQPVLLKPIDSGPLPVRVWNPKVYKGDSFHLMPVITPAYPSMCATFNITRSSMTIIQRELRRGLEISEQIMVGKRPWSDLFVKHTFFTSGYRYYISVISASKDKEAHKIWSGYVESKVRMLVQKLEQHPSIALAHAFNKGYDRRHLCRNEQEIGQVQEGSLEFLIKDEDESKPNGALSEVPIKTENKDGATESVFPVEVYTTTHYIGLELEEGAKSLDLSYQVDEFKVLCTQWKKYQDDLEHLVSLGVQHVRNFNLPDDVFEPGEVKPQKKSSAKSLANKKRGAPEDNTPPAKRQQASVAAVG